MIDFIDALSDKLADHTKKAWCRHDWSPQGAVREVTGTRIVSKQLYVCTQCGQEMSKDLETLDK